MIFTSPTKGQLTFESMFQDIADFISQHPEDHYRLIVGTDSQLRENACFVTAVVVHRVGKGGRYYYTKDTENVGESL
ncbi:MAG: ribonuclease H-like YkuK family protein, partial [Bacillota bacterium]